MAKAEKTKSQPKGKAVPTPKKAAPKVQETVNEAETAAAPTAKKQAFDKSGTISTLTKQFQAVRDTLTSTNNAKKQPRQLRWALKALAMAEEAAGRAVIHAE